MDSNNTAFKANNTSAENFVFTKDHVENLEKLGFRLVGLDQEHKPRINWVNDGPYYDPDYQWSTSKLLYSEADRYTMQNMATMTGPINVENRDGTETQYNLCIFDCDCQMMWNHFNITFEQLFADSTWEWVTPRAVELTKLFLKEEGVVNVDYGKSLFDIIKQSGYVVKSRKPYGFHVPFLDTNKWRPIKSRDCKDGFEFEIHTEAHLSTLPGSSYRPPKAGEIDGNPDFRYSAIGRTDKILKSSIFYDLILEIGKDCLQGDSTLNETQKQEQKQEPSKEKEEKEEQEQEQEQEQKQEYKKSSCNEHIDGSPLSNKIILMLEHGYGYYDDKIEISKGKRHNTLLKIANSILFRYSEDYDLSRLNDWFILINEHCCKPPLEVSERNRIWSDAVDYVGKKKAAEGKRVLTVSEAAREKPGKNKTVRGTIFSVSTIFKVDTPKDSKNQENQEIGNDNRSFMSFMSFTNSDSAELQLGLSKTTVEQAEMSNTGLSDLVSSCDSDLIDINDLADLANNLSQDQGQESSSEWLIGRQKEEI